MMRTDTQAETSIHDIFTQTQRQLHNTLISSLVTNRIVINTTSHARDGGIETTLVSLADHLLQDDRHLFLVNHIGRSHHIVF